MSFKAMAWATEQEITETSPQSHLLLVMASYANEQNECYPSINTLVKKTRLSDKTVRKCLKDLLEMGLIFDTQKVSNFGAKVYLLNVENESDTPSNFTTPRNFTGGSKSSSTPLVNLPQGGSKSSSTPLVDLPPNPIINHKNNHKDNLKYEHTHENPKNQKTSKIEKPSELDEQIWRDFVKTKKQRTKSDLTLTAWNRFFSQVQLAQQKTSHSLNEIFSFWICDVTWQGFNCDWYTQRHTANKEQDYATRLFNEYNAKYGHQSAASTAPVGNVYDLETGVWHENE